MDRIVMLTLLLALPVVLACVLPSGPSGPDAEELVPTITTSVGNDTSPPLREITPVVLPPGPPREIRPPMRGPDASGQPMEAPDPLIPVD